MSMQIKYGMYKHKFHNAVCSRVLTDRPKNNAFFCLFVFKSHPLKMKWKKLEPSWFKSLLNLDLCISKYISVDKLSIYLCVSSLENLSNGWNCSFYYF